MRQPEYSGQFKRDVRQMQKLRALLNLLIEGLRLPVAYRDHPLQGKWRAFRDAHIEPDWILIYKLEGEKVRFERTGRYAGIFDE